MASPIYCDAEGCEAQADRIISDVATGEVLAFCLEHFVGFSIGVAHAAQAEVEAETDGPAVDPETQGPAEVVEEPAKPAAKSTRPLKVVEDEKAAGDEEPAEAAPDD